MVHPPCTPWWRLQAVRQIHTYTHHAEMHHKLRNMIKLHKPEIIPLLHYAAHSVNGTVAQVSPQHLPHQLESRATRENNKQRRRKAEEEVMNYVLLGENLQI